MYKQIQSLICAMMICLCFSSSAQNEIEGIDSRQLHYGIAGKLNVEFSFVQKPSIKMSIVGGIGYNFEAAAFFPSLHTGVILFNNGTTGSNLAKKWYNIQAHFFYSLLGTVKLDTRDFTYEDRYVPFYNFADFTANPLHNPFKSSFSLGAIWVHLPKKIKQRIGFLNANVMGRFQLSYFNDGGPVLKVFGDRCDRYYTGGLTFSYHGDRGAAVNLVELSFIKYTGYTPHAFDIANRMQLDFLVYRDISEFAYNQQRWKLNVSNFDTGFGGLVSLYNINRLDLQDFIHFSINDTYHPDYYKGWRLMFGGKYEYNYLKLAE